jgi:hypothetical protein
MTGQLAEDDMDKAVTDRIEVRQAFSEGAIARVQVLQYGDDPEVEPGQAAVRVFFDWPGRSGNTRPTPSSSSRHTRTTNPRPDDDKGSTRGPGKCQVN